ncbi:hypothetical protein ABTE40_21330, partial [Acinetobacter baumannii]
MRPHQGDGIVIEAGNLHALRETHDQALINGSCQSIRAGLTVPNSGGVAGLQGADNLLQALLNYQGKALALLVIQ